MPKLSNKQHTIQGLLTISKEYLSDKGHNRTLNECKLCQLHHYDLIGICYNCKGCPHSDIIGMVACLTMNTADTRFEQSQNPKKPSLNIRNKLRAEYLQKASVLCESIPSKYFTKSGWSYNAFKSLRKLDEQLAKLSS